MSVQSEVTALLLQARGCYRCLWSHFVKAGELPSEMHQWLRSAFDKRQVADYEAQPVLTDTDVSMMEKQAEQFLTKVQEYLQRQGFL